MHKNGAKSAPVNVTLNNNTKNGKKYNGTVIEMSGKKNAYYLLNGNFRMISSS